MTSSRQTGDCRTPVDGRLPAIVVPEHHKKLRGSMESTDAESRQRIEAVRRFNRFYMQYSDAQHARLPRSEFSITELRILYELARGHAQTAAVLARNLSLDTGYLSRILAGFEKRELISRRPSGTDARQSLIALTDTGRAAHAPLDAAVVDGVNASLAKLTDAEQEQLIGAMQLIERLLGKPPLHGATTLRAPRAGEFGWIIGRQAQLFAGEYGWDHRFEAALAQVVAGFAHGHDASREICWIAEHEGIAVGSALVTETDGAAASMRVLFVEPHARRLGVGAQLLEESVRFAQQAGYTTLNLTIAEMRNDARRLVERAGFRREHAQREAHFGQELVVERWVRALADEAQP